MSANRPTDQPTDLLTEGDARGQRVVTLPKITKFSILIVGVTLGGREGESVGILRNDDARMREIRISF